MQKLLHAVYVLYLWLAFSSWSWNFSRQILHLLYMLICSLFGWQQKRLQVDE